MKSYGSVGQMVHGEMGLPIGLCDEEFPDFSKEGVYGPSQLIEQNEQTG